MKHLLSQKRTAILKRWFELVLDTYPADTAGFLRQEKDKFANPVGHTITRELDEIYQELLGEMKQERLTQCLENILKIRAVQDFAPSEAAGFVFLLKKAARQELAAEIKDNRLISDFMEFESKIDRLALIALDVYMECREKIHEISLKQIKNEREMAFRLIERIAGTNQEETAESQEQASYESQV